MQHLVDIWLCNIGITQVQTQITNESHRRLSRDVDVVVVGRIFSVQCLRLCVYTYYSRASNGGSILRGCSARRRGPSRRYVALERWRRRRRCAYISVNALLAFNAFVLPHSHSSQNGRVNWRKRASLVGQKSGVAHIRRELSWRLSNDDADADATVARVVCMDVCVVHFGWCGLFSEVKVFRDIAPHKTVNAILMHPTAARHFTSNMPI